MIDRTEAMTVVDVNTGKYTGAGGNLEETVTRNNLEAAEEIVRQLRLRDLGGIVVIDFIDMVLESNRELVLRRLTECLGRDRTKHQVTEITSLGLVQMTRKRIGAGLLEAFSETCEHCKGRGVIIHTEPVPEKRGGRARRTRSRRSRRRPAPRHRRRSRRRARRRRASAGGGQVVGGRGRRGRRAVGRRSTSVEAARRRGRADGRGTAAERRSRPAEPPAGRRRRPARASSAAPPPAARRAGDDDEYDMQRLRPVPLRRDAADGAAAEPLRWPARDDPDAADERRRRGRRRAGRRGRGRSAPVPPRRHQAAYPPVSTVAGRAAPAKTVHCRAAPPHGHVGYSSDPRPTHEESEPRCDACSSLAAACAARSARGRLLGRHERRRAQRGPGAGAGAHAPVASAPAPACPIGRAPGPADAGSGRQHRGDLQRRPRKTSGDFGRRPSPQDAASCRSTPRRRKDAGRGADGRAEDHAGRAELLVRR